MHNAVEVVSYHSTWSNADYQWPHTYIAHVPIVSRVLLDAIGHQAHDGRRPQEEGKPSNQVFEELDELRELPWGGDGVGTIPLTQLLHLFLAEALQRRGHDSLKVPGGVLCHTSANSGDESQWDIPN